MYPIKIVLYNIILSNIYHRKNTHFKILKYLPKIFKKKKNLQDSE